MTLSSIDQAPAGDRAVSSRRARRPARRWPVVALLLSAAAAAVLLATRGGGHSYVLGTVRKGTVSETAAVSGALQPARSWSLYFRTAGTVATVRVRAGQHVHRGQVLATLNSGPLRSQVSSAQATVAAAQAKLSGDQAKLDGDQAKLDGDQAKQDARRAGSSAEATAESALITADQSTVSADQSAITADQDAQTAAEQQLTTARANLSAATLRAHAAATVAQVDVAAGQGIGGGGGGGASPQAGPAGGGGSSQPGTSGSAAAAATGGANAAITLENGSLQALGEVSDSQIAQVHVGQRALVTPAGQARPIHGRVQAITPTPTSSGGVTTYPVEIGWRGRHQGVFNGMSAQISIVIAKTSGLTVPSSAVHTSGTQSWVMVVHGARGGQAQGGQETRQVIVAGPSGSGLTIVRSGLHAGEQVVLADNNAPLPSGTTSLPKGSGKAKQIRKLFG